jgi:hypothetical protein
VGGEGLVSAGMSLVFNTHFSFSPTARFQWGYSTLKSVEISSKSSSTEGRAGRFGEMAEPTLAALVVNLRLVVTARLAVRRERCGKDGVLMPSERGQRPPLRERPRLHKRYYS